MYRKSMIGALIASAIGSFALMARPTPAVTSLDSQHMPHAGKRRAVSHATGTPRNKKKAHHKHRAARHRRRAARLRKGRG